MSGREIKEREGSSIGRYLRSTSGIASKWNDIQTGSDINELT